MILCNILTCDKCILYKWKNTNNGISYLNGQGYCSAKVVIRGGN